MRQRFAIAIAALAGGAWLQFAPLDEIGPAQFDRAIDLPANRRNSGGFSGVEVSENGAVFLAISDRGYVLRGRLLRAAGHLAGVQTDPVRPLLTTGGTPVRGKGNDAEGAALAPDGTLYVSFEGQNRILSYAAGKPVAQRRFTSDLFVSFPSNGGMEALAIDAAGTLYALPERIWRRRQPTPVYRLDAQGWTALPGYARNRGFLPVGADVGPDGRLYILERHFKGLGFASRIRSYAIGPDALYDPQIILTTRQGRHGNLEGLSVWRDAQGAIRLTMVSDDNFLPVLPNQVVEYVVPKILANKGAKD